MATNSPPVRLIVNADDFGLTAGVNRAVGELCLAGALSSATLMATGAAFQDGVARALTTSPLGTGCHIVLVDGVPAANPESISSLVNQKGLLQTSLPRFIVDLQRGRISEKEIEREACAQIDRLQTAGVAVTHVDTHKHTHLFPRVARPLLRAAQACGVPAIRNPFEQAWSASLTRGAFMRKLEVTVLRNFQESFRRLLRASGLHSTDGSIGVSATGTLDASSLQLLLDRAEGGTWELVCHPGYNDPDLDAIKTRLRGTRDVEREALLALIPKAVRSGRVELIGFRNL
ncbi:MAG: ChbG/HpnK family deacetylase [Janthinobacterium lividum]